MGVLNIKNIQKIIGSKVHTPTHTTIWEVNRIDEVVTDDYNMVYEIIMRGKGITRNIVEIPIHLYRIQGWEVGYRIEVKGAMPLPKEYLLTKDELKDYSNVLIAIENLLIQNGK